MKLKNNTVGVLGAKDPSPQSYEIAVKLGNILAERGITVICGGLSGIMEAVARGMSEKNGVSIGILPDDSPETANQYITYKIATGIGTARNLIIINSSDFLIAVDGSYGTLSEIAFALSKGKTVLALNCKWKIEGMININQPEEVLNYIE